MHMMLCAIQVAEKSYLNKLACAIVARVQDANAVSSSSWIRDRFVSSAAEVDHAAAIGDGALRIAWMLEHA